ncbi:NAD-dependent epimerase/dehydratase family protein [Paracoccus sp. (in: a-proteobacteria)]|uniref:NAD-dependent epimerase/dehydratase family protein n=1 Tax=Paracoccus sp. TaxID=267 RepID=UPI0032208282
MKILRAADAEGPVILLFGLGLIGGAVDRALRLRFQAVAQQTMAYDWHDPARRRDQRAAIRAALPDAGRIALVWAGGSSGFASSLPEMRQETALLAELLHMAQALRRDRRVDVHMLSSAGGLFEGQTHCGRDSRPAPLRPYGQGKLMQEELLRRAVGLDRRHVYRPSSVYGITRSKRVGLVAALIANALQGRMTRIFGNPNTLRDYVLADDIGQFMARRIMDPDPGPDTGPLLLASGRPASVFEVIERIHERLDRPLMLQFDPHPSNSQDMSFLPSALPTDWRATALGSGIARIVTILRSGSA